jgi:1-acyl-sn-glycerol-3-phosphate acyltransferase
VTVAGKAELLNWPVIGAVVRAYGMIPLRRGEADRAALEQLLRVLAEGQALLIAPEGRESLTGALESAREGAAFLAQHADVAIVPVGITGTAWTVVLPGWRGFRRPCVTLTFGRPYRLSDGLRRSAAASYIMRQIAALLPAEYQGVYGERRPG